MKAQEARELSMTSTLDELKEVEEVIIAAAKRGDFTVVVSNLSPILVERLTDEGFYVVLFQTVGQQWNLAKISWVNTTDWELNPEIV